MDAAKAISEIKQLDEQYGKKSAFNLLNPLTHLTVTMGFIVAVLSFGKYEIVSLTPFILYPVTLILLGDIPPGLVVKRILAVLPMIFLLGVFNPAFDKNHVEIIGVTFPAGWFSLLSLTLKGILTVSAAILLICFTGIGGICAALDSLRMPRLAVSQLAFTYRYIHVLGEDIIRTISAYSLRSPGKRGVSLKQFGSMCGGLLLRSVSHADTVYTAMRCRGFNGLMPVYVKKGYTKADAIYIFIWISFFTLARAFNIPLILEKFVMAA